MDVEVLASSDQVIHAYVKGKNQPDCLFSAAVENPNPQNRERSSMGSSEAG